MEEWILVDPINISEFVQVNLFSPTLNILPQTDNIILLDYPFFFNDLYSSFNYNMSKVMSLFYIDIPRERLIINQIHYPNPQKAETTINNLPISTQHKDLIFMLSTQCVMALPFQILNQIYCKIQSQSQYQQYLAESKNNDSLHIIINDKYLTIEKTLRLFHLTKDGNDKTIQHIKSKIHFNINHSEYLIFTWTTI
jgi:hypothetical protein